MQRELSHTCEKHESKLSPQFQSFPKVVLANSTDVKRNSWSPQYAARYDCKIKQDPVSTMQKTGWTIHSPFLVLFGLKKNFTLDVITRGQATTIFLCIGPFSAWSRTTEQPGDPRASLLLTSVAVFCNSTPILKVEYTYAAVLCRISGNFKNENIDYYIWHFCARSVEH